MHTGLMEAIALGVWRITHTTLRRSRSRFDSWRGHLGSKMRPDQRRASPRPPARRLAARVPYMGSDRKPCQREVSSTVEHQTKNLAVTGSTPVPTPRALTKPATNAARGRRANVRSAAGVRAVRRFVPKCDGAGGGTSECPVVRGYRFCLPSVDGSGCPATCGGARPVGNKPNGSCRAADGLAETEAALRTRTCDRRWFRRPTALLDKNLHEERRSDNGRGKKGEIC
jgi:hypothetical protein